MVVLADTAADKRSAASRPRSSTTPTCGSPASTGCRSTPASAPYVAGSRDACRAVVAARVHAADRRRGRCSARCASATSPARCSTHRRRSRAPRRRPESATRSRPGSPTPRSRRSSSATSTDARRPMPAASRARPQARQLVGRAALHLPELRDHAARGRRDDLGPRLSALRRLRRDPRQPRAGPRAHAILPSPPRRCSPGARPRSPPRRSRWSATSPSTPPARSSGRVADSGLRRRRRLLATGRRAMKRLLLAIARRPRLRRSGRSAPARFRPATTLEQAGRDQDHRPRRDEVKVSRTGPASRSRRPRSSSSAATSSSGSGRPTASSSSPAATGPSCATSSSG